MYYQAVMCRMYYYHGLAQAPEPAISRITHNRTDGKDDFKLFKYYSHTFELSLLPYLMIWNRKERGLKVQGIMNRRKMKLYPRLTRVRSIRFLLFEIKHILVYNSTIFYLTDLSFQYFFIQNAYADKKYPRQKAKQLCLMGQIGIESHSFLEY